MLTAERLRELLQYDRDTGVFTRRATGHEAGGRRRDFYWQISVDGERYLSHRLAWLYVHGHWPAHGIDHINLDRSDNRLVNLREATQSENSANTRVKRNNRSSGVKGVSFNGTKRPRALIMKNRKTVHLGYFDTVEEAQAAYARAAKDLFGEFAKP